MTKPQFWGQFYGRWSDQDVIRPNWKFVTRPFFRFAARLFFRAIPFCSDFQPIQNMNEYKFIPPTNRCSAFSLSGLDQCGLLMEPSWLPIHDRVAFSGFAELIHARDARARGKNWDIFSRFFSGSKAQKGGETIPETISARRRWKSNLPRTKSTGKKIKEQIGYVVLFSLLPSHGNELHHIPCFKKTSSPWPCSFPSLS